MESKSLDLEEEKNRLHQYQKIENSRLKEQEKELRDQRQLLEQTIQKQEKMKEDLMNERLTLKYQVFLNKWRLKIMRNKYSKSDRQLSLCGENKKKLGELKNLDSNLTDSEPDPKKEVFSCYLGVIELDEKGEVHGRGVSVVVKSLKKLCDNIVGVYNEKEIHIYSGAMVFNEGFVDYDIIKEVEKEDDDKVTIEDVEDIDEFDEFARKFAMEEIFKKNFAKKLGIQNPMSVSMTPMSTNRKRKKRGEWVLSSVSFHRIKKK